jgi:hypothetical protein
MDKQRFDSIVAAYGADPRRWPAVERDAALAFAAEAQPDLADARALDALLELAPAPQPASDVLATRVLHDAAGVSRWRFAPAMALAACMVAGVLVGYGAGARAPASDGVDWVLAAAFEGPDDNWIGDGS